MRVGRGSPEKLLAEGADLWAAGRLGRASNGPPEVLFGHVHEDAGVEVAVLAACPPSETAFCIGSGGCTAFSLLTRSPAELYVVDINPAQIYLLELKKAALGHLKYSAMLDCMTRDARPYYPELRAHLTPVARKFWDQRPALLRYGLGRCGLIERRLHRFTRLLLPLLHSRRSIDAMFQPVDLAAQQQFYRERWDNWRWRSLFQWALNRPMLRLLYGKPFVDRIPPQFSTLVKQRVDAAFLQFPIQDNGYLWQAFMGTYPPTEAGLPLFLRRAHHAPVREGLARARLIAADAVDWLTRQPPASIGFFALSNILEVATPDYARRLEAALWRTAKPGALICLRSIFPPAADQPGFTGTRFIHDTDRSEELSRSDRSLLCKFIRIYRVEK